MIRLKMANLQLTKDICGKFSIFWKIHLFVICQNVNPLNQLFQREFDANKGSLSSCMVKSNGKNFCISPLSVVLSRLAIPMSTSQRPGV